MEFKSKIMSLGLIALSLLTSQVLAQENIDNGKKLFASECATCHGVYGEVSNDVVPNILGQYPGYMLTQMQAFLSDDPKNARVGIVGSLKRSILSDMSVQDIKDIVTYLGTIEYAIVGATKKETETRDELAMQGWWLANFAGCGNCHGDDQQGLRVRNPGTGELDSGIGAPFTPKLVGLKFGYLKRQLDSYEDGRRAGGLSAMKHIMAPLFKSPRLLQAVGHYAKDVHVIPVINGVAMEVKSEEESGAEE
ncbi:MAG: c-type cytochrome [Photobacterium frigidiphilum]|uniref:c-type cytochrome n=1 Tax=Photobacterium frigidiphilum TaxID=264736 RepID=UPI003001EABF